MSLQWLATTHRYLEIPQEIGVTLVVIDELLTLIVIGVVKAVAFFIGCWFPTFGSAKCCGVRLACI